MFGLRTIPAVTVILALIAISSASTQAATRPPAPGKVLPAGYVPSACGTGEGTTVDGISYGYYWGGSSGWVSTPWCYPVWGNLTMTAPQIVAGGSTVTMTAVPDTNSAQYAPETNTITWTTSGTVVSGCGTADLSCSVKAPKPGSTWRWTEFHVTMPRIFFVDSPGSLCAGQHLCAGAATNAWSVAGVAPARTLKLGNLVAEVPATSDDPFKLQCLGPGACPSSMTDTLPTNALDTQQQVIDRQSADRAKVWELQKQTRDAVKDMFHESLQQRGQKVERLNNRWVQQVMGSDSSEQDRRLQVADAGLEPVFGSDTTTAAVSLVHRARTARTAALPSAAATVRALTRPRPSAADVLAFRRMLAIARSSSYSKRRAVARVAVSNAVSAGRVALRLELRVRKGRTLVVPTRATIGATTRRVPAGHTVSLRTPRSIRGARILRLLDVVQGDRTFMLAVTVTNRQGTRTRSARTLVTI